MPSPLNPLTGDIEKDLAALKARKTLNPLTGDIERDLGSITNAAPPANPFTSPKGFYGPGVLANVGSRLGGSPQEWYDKGTPALQGALGITAGAVMPWSRALGLSGVLQRLGQGAALGGALGGLESAAKGPLAAAKGGALGALGGATGSGAGEVLRGVGHAVKSPLTPFANQVESQLADWLRQRVPAWANIGSLKEMLYKQPGYDALHQAYDKALKGVVEAGTGRAVNLRGDLAQQLGLAKGASELTEVAVDAAQLAQAMTGKWGKFPQAYRAAAEALDQAGIGDPAARSMYKVASGVRQWANRNKLYEGPETGQFDVLRAQRGLVGKPADDLLRRGMAEDVGRIVNPLGKEIQQGSYAVPGGILGGLAGAAGALPYGWGFGGGGALGGAGFGAILGGKIPYYRNLPLSPRAFAVQGPLAGLGGVVPSMGAPSAEALELPGPGMPTGPRPQPRDDP